MTAGRKKTFFPMIYVMAVIAASSSWASANLTTATVNAGSNPSCVAVNSVTNKIYVTNEGSSTVTVINGANNAISTIVCGSGAAKKTVATGLFKAMGPADPPHWVVVNEVTNRVYVANFHQPDVLVIDGSTDSIIATIKTGNNPVGMIVNPATNKIYVANYGTFNGSTGDGTTVTIIDGATDSTITVTAGKSPKFFAINDVTQKIYLANEDYVSNVAVVTIIDGATNRATNVTVDDRNFNVAVNPVTNTWYASCYQWFQAMNGTTNAKLSDTEDYGFPRFIGVNQTDNKVYYCSADWNSVVVLNAANNTIHRVAIIGTGAHPCAVAVNPVTDKVFLLSEGGLVEVDGVSDKVVANAATGSHPTAIGLNTVTNKLYIPNSWGTTVTVVTADDPPTKTMPGAGKGLKAIGNSVNGDAIRYSIERPGFVNVRYYDVCGRLIGSLVNARQRPGTYTLRTPQSIVSSGAFVMVLKAGNDIYKQQFLAVR